MRILVIGLATSCLALSGCAICASPYDDHYSAFGGRWERDVENHGRVGSLYTQAGYRLDDSDVEPDDGPLGTPGEDSVEDAELRSISYSMPYDESLEGVDERVVDPELDDDPDQDDDPKLDQAQGERSESP